MIRLIEKLGENTETPLLEFSKSYLDSDFTEDLYDLAEQLGDIAYLYDLATNWDGDEDTIPLRDSSVFENDDELKRSEVTKGMLIVIKRMIECEIIDAEQFYADA